MDNKNNNQEWKKLKKSFGSLSPLNKADYALSAATVVASVVSLGLLATGGIGLVGFALISAPIFALRSAISFYKSVDKLPDQAQRDAMERQRNGTNGRAKVVVLKENPQPKTNAILTKNNRKTNASYKESEMPTSRKHRNNISKVRASDRIASR